MKLVSALKKMCEHCYLTRKGKKVYVKCKINPRHKQRQGSGFSSIASNQTLPMRLYFNDSKNYYLDLNEFMMKLPYM